MKKNVSTVLGIFLAVICLCGCGALFARFNNVNSNNGSGGVLIPPGPVESKNLFQDGHKYSIDLEALGDSYRYLYGMDEDLDDSSDFNQLVNFYYGESIDLGSINDEIVQHNDESIFWKVKASNLPYVNSEIQVHNYMYYDYDELNPGLGFYDKFVRGSNDFTYVEYPFSEFESYYLGDIITILYSGFAATDNLTISFRNEFTSDDGYRFDMYIDFVADVYEAAGFYEDEYGWIRYILNHFGGEYSNDEDHFYGSLKIGLSEEGWNTFYGDFVFTFDLEKQIENHPLWEDDSVNAWMFSELKAKEIKL